ncbi:MAG: hypothetical protein L6R28_10195 [Planctomycetes bacterium]|nr:hypothetical protein [Planctomycetota bacterium]
MLLTLLTAAQACGGEWEALRVRTAGAYEFSEKPAVTRAGDRITIAFAVKEACDVTVAIEEPNAQIVRFLASGVLGDNAPAPFAKGSLKQEIVWDGKDEQGRYIDGKEALAVRVSLGLKARYERTLWWSPKKRTSESGELKLVATAAGLYVWDKDSLRLFDHTGEYAKTLYPFPSGSLGSVKGLAMRAFPPEGEFPLKFATAQDTLLRLSFPPGENGWPGPRGGGATATAVAARGDTIVLVNTRVNTIAPDGADLTGPEVTFPVKIGTVHTFPGGVYPTAPKSAALSPDGQWLYLTGYLWHNNWRQGALNGVVRVAMKDGAKPECFLGSMAQGKGGAGDAEFNAPSSVACDAQGRIYVTDYKNSRLQIFSPDGKLAKSIKIDGAALVRVSPKNGEIFVFSWSLQYSYSNELEWKGKPVLRRLASFDDPKVTATYPVEMPEGWDAPPAAEVDFWAEPLTVWLAPAAPNGGKGIAWWMQGNLRQYSIKGGKLELKQDFAKESDKVLARARPARHERQRLYFNPARRLLYIGDHHQPAQIHAKGFDDLTEIDPESGKIAIRQLPYDAEDLAFDLNGLVYMRTVDRIGRYDARTWREVPFDYGDEWEEMTNQGFKTAKTISTLQAAAGGNSSSQYGGMSASTQGHLLVTFYLTSANHDRSEGNTVKLTSTVKYEPRSFPGRSMECIQHIWDKHGKILYEDAVPGFRRTTGVGIDRDDALYLMTDGLLSDGGKPYPNPGSCTLVKVLPHKAKVLSAGKLPVPLAGDAVPKRPPDLTGCLGPDEWVEGAEWMFAGVGIDAKRQHCHCVGTSQIALDYFKRTFAPEIQRYDVVAVDANGNPLLRIGRYGNIDEGKPLVPAGGPEPTELGGDETALFNPRFLAVETDRRLFVADPGNNRVLSVKLDYHATERVALKDVPDTGQ